MGLNEEWSSELIGKMHRHKIKANELARQSGYTAPYVSMLMNGKKPANEKTIARLYSALEELEHGNNNKA